MLFYGICQQQTYPHLRNFSGMKICHEEIDITKINLVSFCLIKLTTIAKNS